MNVKFGTNLSISATLGTDPVATVRAAEHLGFDFISANDHPCGTEPTFESWTMLCWVAAQTSRIKIANRVLGVPYRSPALVAKMAETFDRLSGGRLILGLGGGSADDEFRAFGLGVPSPREKIIGLEEAITIIRGLWTQRKFTFTGQRYHTDHADIEPKPERRIPIWLGTFGDRALDVTGQLADGWIPSLGNYTLEQVSTMRERVLSAAQKVGRDREAITCVGNVEIRIDEHAKVVRSGLIGPTITGSPHSVAEQLLSVINLGFNAINFILAGPDSEGQMERLAGEVLPILRAAVGINGDQT